MKKGYSYILILVFLSIIVINSIRVFRPYKINFAEIYIDKGSSTREIARMLKDKGIISSKSLFLIITKLRGLDGKLGSGLYQFSDNYTINKVIDKLANGQVVKYKVVIPEGYNLQEISKLLANHFKDKSVSDKHLINQNRFDSLVVDTIFIHSQGINASNLEGFLFPDTYYIPSDFTEEMIIKAILHNFRKQVYPLFHKVPCFDSLYNIIKLASIIEKETMLDNERPIISGVYHNRLKRNMLLQADPTVAYALEQKKIFRKTIYYKDLKINSPYNTYRYLGLPPTPICNPGLMSIKAAIHPANTDYYYFFARKGRHIFSNTYKQHLARRRND